ncbi:serine hydrolase [Mycolicibacterium fortuitum]|uniref:tat pathway signal sequence n=1 Tax=Mycolicibacterium fortuitum TaxID=1766 RepID=UPI000AAE6091|nr:tat pathway signal sequence [Mycolicibacterium fortuitum]
MRRLLSLAVVLAAFGAGTTVPSASATCATPANCAFTERVAVADAYLSTRPGTVGYVLRDRTTGAVYRNAHAGEPVWTASTIKLGMVVDLLTRQRAGTVRLTDSDRTLMAAMLHSSDDDAADTLWSRYSGADHQAFNADFPAYGLTGMQPQRGFSRTFPYWGFQKATPEDLDRLINYTLSDLPAAETAEIVDALQHVDTNQQWGVWGAGAAMNPGNKDGWSLEQGGWVVNSVGFAGPRQRYTLAIMNALGDEGGYDDGVKTTTHLSELLLAGHGD